MGLSFEPVAEADAGEVIAFLCGSDWPFHAVRQLSVAQAEAVSVSNADTESFWIRDGDVLVGLVRLLDLDDLEDGSPLFDLRVGEARRSRGIGTAAVHWLSDHLFHEHPTLHRIEATTRSDNAAMMAVLERCGYRLEGVFREAWKDEDGTRHDTMAYALLRREWSGSK